MSQTECEGIHGAGMITSHNICTRGHNGTIGTCFGDSGGPLVCWSEDSKTYRQAGVVSWGVGCDGSYPDVFSAVSFDLQFIHSIMQGSTDFYWNIFRHLIQHTTMITNSYYMRLQFRRTGILQSLMEFFIIIIYNNQPNCFYICRRL